MTTTIPGQPDRDSMSLADAVTAFQAKNFRIEVVAEFQQDNGVRVRATMATDRSPVVGLSRIAAGVREHLRLEGYHTVGGLVVPFDPASAFEYAKKLVGTSDRWAVTR